MELMRHLTAASLPRDLPERLVCSSGKEISCSIFSSNEAQRKGRGDLEALSRRKHCRTHCDSKLPVDNEWHN